MGNRYNNRNQEAGANDPETLDKAEGWKIIHRFKSKAALALFANNPDKLADLEFQYPLETYRRKLDLDRCYLAVLRR